VPITSHEEKCEALRQLLMQGPAQTQGKLVDALNALGHNATQSSVSRNLKELGAIKTAAGYELPIENTSDENHFAEVKDLLRAMFPAGPNLLVVDTEIGAAQRVALAFDRCNWPEIVGSIGGDDTVFVATESGVAQKNIISRIEHSARL